MAQQQSLTRLLCGGRRPMVRRQICIQRKSNWGRGMPDLELHWLAERLAYLGRTLSGVAMWRRKASMTFPRLQSDPKAESRRWSMGEKPFVRECRKALRNLPGSSDLLQSPKKLYQELVVGSVSDPLSERHCWTAEEVRVSWTIPSSPSPGGLHGTHCPFSGWTSERAWQTCLIALAAAVVWNKWLNMPSTTTSGFARSEITSESRQFASNLNSLCCSTLVTSWTTFCLRFRVRSVWCFSWS